MESWILVFLRTGLKRKSFSWVNCLIIFFLLVLFLFFFCIWLFWFTILLIIFNWSLDLNILVYMVVLNLNWEKRKTYLFLFITFLLGSNVSLFNFDYFDLVFCQGDRWVVFLIVFSAITFYFFFLWKYWISLSYVLGLREILKKDILS